MQPKVVLAQGKEMELPQGSCFGMVAVQVRIMTLGSQDIQLPFLGRLMARATLCQVLAAVLSITDS